MVQTVRITGAYTNWDGTGIGPRPVTIRPNAKFLYDPATGSEINVVPLTVHTDPTSGGWYVDVPISAAYDPNVDYTLSTPSGAAWSGPLPQELAGTTVNLEQLKTGYGWGFVQTPLVPVATIQGSPGLVWHQSWSSTQQYVVNDVVSYNGGLWAATKASFGQAPSSISTYWSQIFGGTFDASPSQVGIVLVDIAPSAGSHPVALTTSGYPSGAAHLNPTTPDTGSISVTGDATLGGHLLVGSASTLSSTLDVTGAVTAHGSASVSGALTVAGATSLANLSAAAATLASAAISANASVGGALTVTGSAATGPLTAGASTLASAGIAGNATVGGTLGVTGTATFAGVSAGATSLTSAAISGSASVGGAFGVAGTSTLGSLSAGASTLSTAAVTNNATIGGTLSVGGSTTLLGLSAQASTLASLGVTGGATVGGAFGVSGTTTLANVSASAATLASAAVSGNTTIGGTLGVTGTVSTGPLTVSGSATVGGLTAAATSVTSLAVSNAANLAYTLTVVGQTTLGGLTAGVSTLATAGISGNASVGGTLGVTGTTTLAGVSAGAATLASATISGNTTISGNLSAGGATTLAGLTAGTTGLTSLAVTNNTTLGGTLGVTGAITGPGTGISGLAPANFAGGVSANVVLAGPALGGPGAVGFRALVQGDIPSPTGDVAGTFAATQVLHLGNVTDGSLGSAAIGAGAVTNVAIASGVAAAKIVGSLTSATIPAGGITGTLAGSQVALATISSVGTIKVGSGLAVDSFGNLTNAGVTSVALVLPAIFSITASPVTTTGSLTASLAPQAQNLVFAGPSTGISAAPTFRALAAADIPAPAGDLGGTYAAMSVLHLGNVTDNSLTSAGIGAGAVGDAAVASGIAAAKISGALTNATIVVGSLTGSLAGDVSGPATNVQVTNLTNVTNGSIATAALASGAVTAVKLSVSAPTSGQVSGLTTANLSVTAGIVAGQIASINPSVLTGTGTVPLAALSGITASQLSVSAGLVGSQLSATAGIVGSQLAASAGIVAGQIASVSPATLTGSGTVPLAALLGITSVQIAAAAGITGSQLSSTAGILGSQLSATAAIADGQITGLSATKLTGTIADARLSANVALLGATSNAFAGNITVAGTFATTGATTLAGLTAGATSVSGLAVSGASTFAGGITASLGTTASFDTLAGGATTLASVSVAGAASSASLAVSGNGTVGGTLGVTGATTLAGLTAGTTSVSSLAVSGNSTITGTLGAGATTLASLGVSGNGSVTGTLGVGGASTLAGLSAGATTLASVGVTGAATVGNTLNVTGATTLSGALSVVGTTTVGSLTAGITTATQMGVSGNASIGGTLGVTGDTSLGNATANGTLTVVGTSTLATLGAGASTVASLTATGAASVGTSLSVAGVSTLAALTATATTVTAFSASGAATLGSTLAVTGTTTLSATVTLADGVNLSVGTVTGTQIGQTGSKLGFFGAAPIAMAGSTTDLRAALISYGLYTAGGATPLDLNGGALTTGAATLASAAVAGAATVGGTLAVTGTISGPGTGLSGLAAGNFAVVGPASLLIGPVSGINATPTFRILAQSDVPAPTGDVIGTYAATQVTNLSNVTNGSVSAAALGTGAVTAVKLSVAAPSSGQLSGLTTANLSGTAGIVDGQIAGLAAAKLTGMTQQGDLFVGGVPASGVAPPAPLHLPVVTGVPAAYTNLYPPLLASGTVGGATGPAYVVGHDHISGLSYGMVADATSNIITPGTTNADGTGGTIPGTGGVATDNTAALQAAVNAVCLSALASGGGDLHIPAALNGYWIAGQITVPVFTGSSAKGIRIYGTQADNASNGTYLIFTYRSAYEQPTIAGITNASYDPAFLTAPYDAKILCRGSGMVQLERMGWSVGMANFAAVGSNLSVPYTDHTPFVLATGAPVKMRDLSVNGGGYATQAYNFGAQQNWFYLGVAPHTDLLVCGNPADPLWSVGNGGFHGYGAHISDCDITGVRRILYARGANAANEIYVDNVVVHDGAGNIESQWGALIDIEGFACSVVDNSLTLSVGGTGFRLAGQNIAIHQSAVWDAKVTYATLAHTPPVTWITAPALAGATAIPTSGYLPSFQQTTATGGRRYAVESTPIVTLGSAATANSTATLKVAITSSGGQVSDAGLLSGAALQKGSFARIYDTNAAGQPIPTMQELWWVTATSGPDGSGFYSVSTALPAAGSVFARHNHPAGTLVQLFPAVVTQPFVRGATSVVVASDSGGLIVAGSWIKVNDVTFNGNGGFLAPLPGYAEWFIVNAKSGPDANGNYTLTLNRPASLTHTTMQTPIGQTVAGVKVSSVTSSTVFVATSVSGLVVGVPITIHGVTTNIQSISGTTVTLDAANTAMVANDAITASVPTTYVEVWSNETLGSAGQPTAAYSFQVGSSFRPQALTVQLTNGTPNPALPAIPSGQQVVTQQVTTPVQGTNVQLPVDSQATGATEYFSIASTDYANAVLYLDHGATVSHNTGNTDVAIGPFTNTASALLQNHWSGQRVMANTLVVAQPLTQHKDMPIWLQNGLDEGERFMVLSYAPQNPAAQSTTLSASGLATYARGATSFTVTAIPSGWIVGTTLAIGPQNPVDQSIPGGFGTFQFGKTDYVTIFSISVPTKVITVVNQAGSVGASTWFSHAAGEGVSSGPYVMYTTPFSRQALGGSCWVGSPFVEEPSAGGNDIWFGTTALPNAGISLARDNGPLPSGTGTSHIRQALPGMISSIPNVTQFAKGIVLPTLGGTPNKAALTASAAWSVPMDGWVGIDGPNQTVTVEMRGAPQPIANTTGYPVTMSGAPYAAALTVTGTLSANFPLLHVGSGPADEVSAGRFAGVAGGTVFGSNMASGFAGDFQLHQIAGVTKWEVSSTGQLIAGSILTSILTASGAVAASGNTTFSGTNSFSAAATFTNTITASVVPALSAASAALMLGAGGFAGAQGNFNGSASGTIVGVNLPSAFRGNWIDVQNLGFSRIAADYRGNLSMLGLTPLPPTLSSVSGTGGLMVGDGTSAWQYKVTYNATNGETLGSTTLSVTSVNAATGSVVLTIPQGPAGISGIDVYRTALGGATFARLSSGQNTINASISGSGTISYTDTQADAAISGFPALPTADNSAGSLSIGGASIKPLTGMLGITGQPIQISNNPLYINASYLVTGTTIAITGAQTGDVVTYRSSTLGRVIFGNAAGTLDYGESTGAAFTFAGGDVILADGLNIRTGTTTGMKIGTQTTQKIGFFAATPVAQQAQTTDLKAMLVNLGLYSATVGTTPLNLGTGVITGTGSGLTGLAPSALTGSGTVPLAALSGITTTQLAGAAGIVAGQLAVSAPSSGQLGGLAAANFATVATPSAVLIAPTSVGGGAPTFRALLPADLPVATGATLGAVQPDGTTITISAGVISSIGGSPTGAAGGDLAGTFPNPTVSSLAHVSGTLPMTALPAHATTTHAAGQTDDLYLNFGNDLTPGFEPAHPLLFQSTMTVSDSQVFYFRFTPRKTMTLTTASKLYLLTGATSPSGAASPCKLAICTVSGNTHTVQAKTNDLSSQLTAGNVSLNGTLATDGSNAALAGGFSLTLTPGTIYAFAFALHATTTLPNIVSMASGATSAQWATIRTAFTYTLAQASGSDIPAASSSASVNHKPYYFAIIP